MEEKQCAYTLTPNTHTHKRVLSHALTHKDTHLHTHGTMGEKKLRDHLVIKPDSLQRWHAIKSQLTKIFLTGAFNQQFFPLEITKWLKRLQLGHNGGIDGYVGHSIQDVTTWHKTWQSVPCRRICAVLTKTVCMPYEAFIKSRSLFKLGPVILYMT
jgi:hypothetical protein